MKHSIRNNIAFIAAFTLLELMVVITLVGVLTALIIPEMRGTYEHELLRSAAREIVSVCNLASSRAVAVSQTHYLQINSITGHYILKTPSWDDEDNSAILRDFKESEGQIDKRISFSIQRERSVETEETGEESEITDGKADAGQDESIAFYADGSAEYAEFALKDRHGFSLQLRINPATSLVKISEVKQENLP
jgi:prepilin-type N-terminal cleavage/methylation domain-containing protein